MKTKWETVGIVSVDAGILWVGDPCYVLHQEEPVKDIGKDWGEFCDKILKDDAPGTQLNHNNGGPGLAVVVGGFGGDGVWPVEVKMKDGMVSEMRVKFF